MTAFQTSSVLDEPAATLPPPKGANQKAGIPFIVCAVLQGLGAVIGIRHALRQRNAAPRRLKP